MPIDQGLPTRRRTGAVLCTALLLSACGSGVDAQAASDATAGVEAPGTARQPASVPQQIDPDPGPASDPEIVSSQTIQVTGEPACAYTIRYPGHIDQDVTWRREPCEAVSATFLRPAALEAAGQLNDLPPEARRDIERMESGVFSIQSEFTASAYPLNVAGRIYEVPYID